MACSREGFTVRIQRSGSAAPAGVGFVVDDAHIITCAHVVNTALGHDQRAQEKPGSQVRIQVDFPMLGNAGGPHRVAARCRRGCRRHLGEVRRGCRGLMIVGEICPVGLARHGWPIWQRCGTCWQECSAIRETRPGP